MGFNVNWFLGVLAIELWLAPYILLFWPEISEAWRQRRHDRQLRRYAAQYRSS